VTVVFEGVAPFADCVVAVSPQISAAEQSCAEDTTNKTSAQTAVSCRVIGVPLKQKKFGIPMPTRVTCNDIFPLTYK
jgi:hypothetical protein